MSNLLRRLYCPPFGTETSERKLMVEAADRIAELEAAVATLMAERDQLIGALQIAVERSGDMEHPPAWADAACCILNRGFLKVDRAALGGGEAMSDGLVKRLRATTDGATVNPDGPEAADRIAELEAVLLVLETEIVKLDLDYLDFLRVGRIINAALTGGKQ